MAFINKNQEIRLKPEWLEPGEDEFRITATEDIDLEWGRGIFRWHCGLPLDPTSVIQFEWVESVKVGEVFVPFEEHVRTFGTNS